MSIHDKNKDLLLPLRAAWRSGDQNRLRAAVFDVFAPEARIRLGAPFNDLDGPKDLWESVYVPLLKAMPDMERLEFIVMSGPRWGTGTAGNWVGLAGNIVGTLQAPWLGIPATNRPVFARYHEYVRIEDGQIVEMQGLWDVAQIMHQCGVFPMSSQAGVEWMCPGPGNGQGIVTDLFDRMETLAQSRIAA